MNWGLGHASRMIPLINNYLAQGYEVILAGNGYSLELLKNEFPDLEFISIPFTEIRYGRGQNQILYLIFGFGRFYMALMREHRVLNSIIREKKIDIVISDNRLGLFSKKAKCVILTHQVWLPMPRGWDLLGIIANKFNHHFIRKFNEYWIVDANKSPTLAGKLSHPPLEGIQAKYVGPISRFAGLVQAETQKKGIMVILGGPEPQRSILEKILIRQLSETKIETVIAGGTSKSKPITLPPNITYIPFIDGKGLYELIQKADIIISRSGYSSVMDLVALRRSAILIPTPGQPEQEYLGELLSEKGYFLNYKQSEFDLQKAIEDWRKFTPKFPDIKFNQFPALD